MLGRPARTSPVVVASHLPRPDPPQPSARRQLRLGHRRDLRARPTCRCSTPSSATPASSSPSTTAARSSTGSRPSGPSSSSASRRLVARGQVEIVGGGWYEPVLAALPERDRVGQLDPDGRRAGASVRRPARAAPGSPSASGSRTCRPRSSTAGYGWTVLDDAHFRAAAIPEEALWGPYTTDDQGKVLTVFGTEQGLRYRIPFSEVDEVIGYLRDHATEAGDRVGTMGDDGEKFGGWPTTFEHCWGETGWVERFFSALEANSDWLTTVTPSSWLDGHGPVGRVYLPTGSYAEMGEWALPADEALAFATAVHDAKAAGRPEARWLRGAIWRNFQVKYREVNDIHKQMLRASDLVDGACRAGSDRDAALDHLYAGQSNDCYWHGLFGGIYLPDLRVAALSRLIAAEDMRPRRTGGAASRPDSSSTSTSTGPTRRSSSTTARSSPSSSTRAPGSGAGTSARPATRWRP